MRNYPQVLGHPVRVHASLSDVLSDPEVRVVLLALPAPQLAQAAELCLAAGRWATLRHNSSLSERVLGLNTQRL